MTGWMGQASARIREGCKLTVWDGGRSLEQPPQTLPVTAEMLALRRPEKKDEMWGWKGGRKREEASAGFGG